MADIFSVIADPTRREILDLLRLNRENGVESSVSEIVDALGVAQPTISKHLAKLREVELVEVREEGQHRFYSLNALPLEVVDDWILPFVFENEVDAAAGGLGAAAFAAWAGANVTTPLRERAEQAKERVSEVVSDPAQLGTSIGRKVADAAFDVQERVHGLQERASGVLHEVGERFGRGNDAESGKKPKKLDK
ncbi:ArsR/SmtB family transcription factor [Humidisolicoccus flavus]|uniref:ArsR/SmtB family transcription factor n=1 Tax=Humidisolicoccus flavus TaxID=3111414 RepID=UPI003D3016E8